MDKIQQAMLTLTNILTNAQILLLSDNMEFNKEIKSDIRNQINDIRCLIGNEDKNI